MDPLLWLFKKQLGDLPAMPLSLRYKYISKSAVSQLHRCIYLLWFCVLQDSGLVPIVEPEILLDGEHNIDRTYEVAEKVWAEVFFYLAQNNVMFEGNTLNEVCFKIDDQGASKQCNTFDDRHPPEAEHGYSWC